jgi:hypothetical protein
MGDRLAFPKINVKTDNVASSILIDILSLITISFNLIFDGNIFLILGLIIFCWNLIRGGKI